MICNTYIVHTNTRQTHKKEITLSQEIMREVNLQCRIENSTYLHKFVQIYPQNSFKKKRRHFEHQ